MTVSQLVDLLIKFCSHLIYDSHLFNRNRKQRKNGEKRALCQIYVGLSLF